MKHLNNRVWKALLGLLLLPLCSMAQEDIAVGNSTRNMIVIAPDNIEQGRPLLINMHGMNQSAAFQQNEAKWESITDTARFVVVLPNGIGNAWDISGTRDVEFITTIIDTMHNRLGIDRNRVYLSGFSMGGMMTYHAANFIADKIAAFAPVSGYPLWGSVYNSSRPVSIMHIQGEADDVVEYSDALDNYLKGWANYNNCAATAQVIAPYPANKSNSIATKYYWGPGDGGVEVVLITQKGKGHWWSLDTNSGIHTSAEVWNFCKRFALDPNKPQISLTLPANANELTPFDTLSIGATVTDADGSISSVEYFDVFADTLLYATNSAPYVFDWGTLPVGTYKIKVLATDNDGKTSDAGTVINVRAPVAPAFSYAVPQQNSFNLPLSTSEFQFEYTKVVDCSKVKAMMVGATDTLALELQETGFSNTLSFQLPAGASLSQGEYAITVSDIFGEHEVASDVNSLILYSFGDPDPNAAPTTVFTDGWNAEGIIPQGWKITYGANVREQEETYGLGPRALQFGAGGEFDYGMYLRDEGDTCRLSYGNYSNSRLVLKPGMHTLSFYYSWWTEGAANSGLKIHLKVTDTLGTVIYQQRNISTAHSFNSNKNDVVNGSQFCDYSFNISKEQPYILEWSTINFGYDGAIVGGINLTAISSAAALANKYQAMLNTAIEVANIALQAADSANFDGAAKTALQNAVAGYASVSYTTTGEYQAAQAALQSATANLKVAIDAAVLVDQSKALLQQALVAAKASLQAADSSIFDGAIKTALHNAISKYTDAAYTTTAKYQTATETVQAATTAMDSYVANFDYSTGMSGANNQSLLLEVQYFDLMGRRMDRPVKGLIIKKSIYEDGTTKVQKVLVTDCRNN